MPAARHAFLLGLLPGALGAASLFGCVNTEVEPVDACPKVSDVGYEYTLRFADQVDVLFVMDNSSSMGDAQVQLVSALQAMLGALDEAAPSGVALDVRMGFTTTDMGNVECTGTSPERGKLRLVPATERLDEFCGLANPSTSMCYFEWAQLCPAATDPQLQAIPTAIGDDAPPRPRPWIERLDGELNVEGGDLDDALACYAPQGVDGCGFEAQLEAMRRAVRRSRDPASDQFGFLRPESTKIVFFVTDEADGSANPAHQAAVFDPDLPASKKVFWSDPESDIPTSAITWNAGTACTGDGMPYDTCVAADYAADGTSIPADRADDEAVLFPVSRYVRLLEGLGDDVDGRLLVGGLVGVPPGYDGNASTIPYRDAEDPDDQRALGIDFGCSNDDPAVFLRGVPPVRLRELVETVMAGHDGTTLYSICADDYAPALEDIARRAGAMAHHACYRQPVMDVEPDEPGLQLDCSVSARDQATGQVDMVPPCTAEGTVPADATPGWCFIARAASSPACLADDATAEIELVQRPGTPRPLGYELSALCAAPRSCAQ